MGEIPKIEPHQPNDPLWQRFRGYSADFVNRLYVPPTVERSGQPTIGIGGYNCVDCKVPHIAFALVTTDGREINAIADPETAVAVVQALVEAIGRVGHSLLALQALRALSLVNQLATMTDTEADFLDGGGLRESCRLMLNGKPMVLPRYYDDADRDRAANVLRRLAMSGQIAGDAPQHHGASARYGAAVDAIAEALGLQRPGG